MPRHIGGRDRCAACNSGAEQLVQLNSDLVAGLSQREVARRYQISRSSIQRHARAHLETTSLVRLEAALVPAAGANGSMASSEDVVAEARHLYDDCRAALDSAL
jgi:transposase